MTHRTMLVLTTIALFAGCTADSEGEALSKDQAAGLYDGGKDDGVDFCEAFGWYGDDECDTFCPLADHDCSEDECTVGADSTCGIDEVCQPGGSLFYCPDGAASCREPATCQPTSPDALSCTEDADCSESQWCRATREGGFACVDFVPEGGWCGTFAPEWGVEMCAPGLDCVYEDGVEDGAGTCTAPSEPDDCRSTGCDTGEHCSFCWTRFLCLPDGAIC